jgi:predicted transcriptional regulator
MSVQVSALEARIIGILKDWYPITVEELRDELSLRKDVLERTLKSLVLKGVIVLEPLSDKTYIRLLVPEIDLAVTGKKSKRKKSPPDKQLDDDSIMYR